MARMFVTSLRLLVCGGAGVGGFLVPGRWSSTLYASYGLKGVRRRLYSTISYAASGGDDDGRATERAMLGRALDTSDGVTSAMQQEGTGPLGGLSVLQLREECRRRGLKPAARNRAELLALLQEWQRGDVGAVGEQMSLDKLRDELKARGYKVVGKSKKELLEMLRLGSQAEGQANGADVAVRPLSSDFTEPREPSTVTLPSGDLGTMTLAQLREAARDAGLRVAGRTKGDLMDLLRVPQGGWESSGRVFGGPAIEDEKILEDGKGPRHDFERTEGYGGATDRRGLFNVQDDDGRSLRQRQSRGNNNMTERRQHNDNRLQRRNPPSGRHSTRNSADDQGEAVTLRRPRILRTEMPRRMRSQLARLEDSVVAEGLRAQYGLPVASQGERPLALTSTDVTDTRPARRSGMMTSRRQGSSPRSAQQHGRAQQADSNRGGAYQQQQERGDGGQVGLQIQRAEIHRAQRPPQLKDDGREDDSSCVAAMLAEASASQGTRAESDDSSITTSDRIPAFSSGNSTGCDLELCFLGTASCVPSVSRSVSCIAMRMAGDTWLFDVGEGSQVQVQRSQIRPSRISKIFVTHAHGDHSFGLPGMLCLMGMEREQFETSPVDIYGPEGLRMFLRTIIRFTISRIVPRYRVHEIRDIPSLHRNRRAGTQSMRMDEGALPLDTKFGEVEGGKDLYPDAKGVWQLLEEGDVTVQAAPMVHTVPCVGFVIDEKSKPGRLRAEYVRPMVERNREQLLASGVKDPNKIFRLLKTLQPGEYIDLPDGTTLRCEDVMDPPKPGRKVVICGDTCDASSLAGLGRNCDVLVHEATNAFLPPFDKGTYKDVEDFAVGHGHSTPQMAGEFAREIGAKKLVMTHFSPRYKGDAAPESRAIMRRLEDMARKSSGLDADDVIAAHDLMVVPVPAKRQVPSTPPAPATSGGRTG